MIIIRFSEAFTLPFCFRWASTTCACSTRVLTIKPAQRASRQFSLLTRYHGTSRCALAYLHRTCITVRKLYCPSETKMAAYPLLHCKNRMSVTTNSEIFTFISLEMIIIHPFSGRANKCAGKCWSQSQNMWTLFVISGPLMFLPQSWLTS